MSSRLAVTPQATIGAYLAIVLAGIFSGNENWSEISATVGLAHAMGLVGSA